MPTSNGQITSRDLRKGLLASSHFPSDPLVETGFIQDLAVTFPDKIDDPIWVTTFGTFTASNETITTTRTTFVSEVVDVPAWVDQVSVFLFGALQASTSSTQLLNIATIVDGVGGGGTSHEAQSQTQITFDVTVANLAGVAGSSITVELEAFVSSGTNASNQMYLYGFVVGQR